MRVRVCPTILTLISPLLLSACVSNLAENPIIPVAVTVPGKNVDSAAIWIAPEPEKSLVLLTEKGGGQVMVLKADRSAALLSRFGKMKRPNGVAVLQRAAIGALRKGLAFVTDRDGNIVHLYSIPDFQLVGTFGADVPQPMGISVYCRKSDSAVFAFVVAKRATGNDKVIRFRIAEQDGRVIGTRDLQFGLELSVGQENVVVDGERELVLVADENEREIKVYDTEGRWRSNFGKGKFEAQVEGIAIAACGQGGYILATDQKVTTEFEVFDRVTFKHLGTVRGTAMRTDGIALAISPLPDYPNGLFVAQSDPDGSGGRHAEFYDFGNLLESIRLSPCKLPM